MHKWRSTSFSVKKILLREQKMSRVCKMYLLLLELSLLREGLLDDDLLRFFLSLLSPSDCFEAFPSAAISVVVPFVELLSVGLKLL